MTQKAVSVEDRCLMVRLNVIEKTPSVNPSHEPASIFENLNLKVTTVENAYCLPSQGIAQTNMIDANSILQCLDIHDSCPAVISRKEMGNWPASKRPCIDFHKQLYW